MKKPNQVYFVYKLIFREDGLCYSNLGNFNYSDEAIKVAKAYAASEPQTYFGVAIMDRVFISPLAPVETEYLDDESEEYSA